MTDPEEPNLGSAPERLGVPDSARDVHGPVGRLDFPGSVALRCPDPASALGGPCTSQRPVHGQGGRSSAWPPPPRGSLPLCLGSSPPSAQCPPPPPRPPGHAQCRCSLAPPPPPQRPRPLRPGPMAPRPPTSHRPARPGHAQCGRSGLGPGSAGAAAGCRRGGSRVPRGARGRVGAERRSCRVGAGAAEPGHWARGRDRGGGSVRSGRCGCAGPELGVVWLREGPRWKEDARVRRGGPRPPGGRGERRAAPRRVAAAGAEGARGFPWESPRTPGAAAGRTWSQSRGRCGGGRSPFLHLQRVCPPPASRTWASRLCRCLPSSNDGEALGGRGGVFPRLRDILSVECSG